MLRECSGNDFLAGFRFSLLAFVSFLDRGMRPFLDPSRVCFSDFNVHFWRKAECFGNRLTSRVLIPKTANTVLGTDSKGPRDSPTSRVLIPKTQNTVLGTDSKGPRDPPTPRVPVPGTQNAALGTDGKTASQVFCNPALLVAGTAVLLWSARPPCWLRGLLLCLCQNVRSLQSQ